MRKNIVTSRGCCYPFDLKLIKNWLEEAAADCENGLFPLSHQGTRFYRDDICTYWTKPEQYLTWWKNHIVRKVKLAEIIRHADYEGTDENHIARASFSKDVIRMAEVIQTYIIRTKESSRRESVRERDRARNKGGSGEAFDHPTILTMIRESHTRNNPNTTTTDVTTSPSAATSSSSFVYLDNNSNNNISNSNSAATSPIGNSSTITTPSISCFQYYSATTSSDKIGTNRIANRDSNSFINSSNNHGNSFRPLQFHDNIYEFRNSGLPLSRSLSSLPYNPNPFFDSHSNTSLNTLITTNTTTTTPRQPPFTRPGSFDMAIATGTTNPPGNYRPVNRILKAHSASAFGSFQEKAGDRGRSAAVTAADGSRVTETDDELVYALPVSALPVYPPLTSPTLCTRLSTLSIDNPFMTTSRPLLPTTTASMTTSTNLATRLSTSNISQLLPSNQQRLSVSVCLSANQPPAPPSRFARNHSSLDNLPSHPLIQHQSHSQSHRQASYMTWNGGSANTSSSNSSNEHTRMYDVPVTVTAPSRYFISTSNSYQSPFTDTNDPLVPVGLPLDNMDGSGSGSGRSGGGSLQLSEDITRMMEEEEEESGSSHLDGDPFCGLTVDHHPLLASPSPTDSVSASADMFPMDLMGGLEDEKWNFSDKSESLLLSSPEFGDVPRGGGDGGYDDYLSLR